MSNLSPKSNQYALAALRERRAELSGEIRQLEQRLRSLRTSLTHLDGALAMMAPGFDPSTIKAKRPYKRVKLFGQGKLNGHILDALRRGARAMTTAEVTDAVAEAVNFGPDAAQGLKSRVRANLLYLTKVRGLVAKDGDRETAVWGLALN